MMSDIQKECDPSDVILEVNDTNDRKVKRVIHFSDGNLVEYEGNDDKINTSKIQSHRASMDEKAVGWVPWTWNQTSWFSSKLVGGCDYVGEALANFLGITAPKYQFEIEEFNRIQRANLEEKQREELELAGWREPPENDPSRNEPE